MHPDFDPQHPEQMNLKGEQAHALIEVLQHHVDGGDVLLTRQGDGSLVVAFSLATVEITTEGTVFAE